MKNTGRHTEPEHAENSVAAPKRGAVRNLSADSLLVSVVTPCYNAAPFITETIASVRAQTYPAIEHIVVDDGSTDESWDIVRSYGSRITPLRLEQNRGGSYARNQGAERARGEFLLFLDADDTIAPDTIASLVNAVHDRPGSIAYCKWQRLGQVDARWVTLPAEVPLPPPGADYLSGWLTGSWVPTCSVLWRRDAYERTGGWDEDISWGDDGDLMLRALVRGARLVLAEGGEGYYRSHGAGRLAVSSDFSSEHNFRSQMRVFEKLEAELERQGRLPHYAIPIGLAYYRLVSRGFQQGLHGLARECLRRGKSLAGPRVVSRTLAGRLLTRLLGVERTEKIAAVLARFGIATSQRRQIRQLRRLRAPRDQRRS
jgi:glycosyltransferase involved in cell wall biosynthesis